MISKLLGAALATLIALPLHAQNGLLLGVESHAAAGGAYVGPGDVVASATAWWGLRAYSAATAGGNAIDIRRASDSTTCTAIKTKANGDLDIGTGTPCAGSTTVNSWCTATNCFVSKLYDQTGNGNDQLQATTANQPQLVFNCLGSFPCMKFVAASVDSLATAGAISQSSTTTTHSWTAQRTASFTLFGKVIGTVNDTMTSGFRNSANLIYCGEGGIDQVAATDSVWHAAECVFTGGVSSIIDVDGANTTTNLGNTADNSRVIFGATSGGSGPTDGNIMEGGIWPSAFSSGNATSMASNQKTYWGF